MIALFFATRIINGNSTFERVPKLIEKEVTQILKDKGHEDLIEEEADN